MFQNLKHQFCYVHLIKNLVECAAKLFVVNKNYACRPNLECHILK